MVIHDFPVPPKNPEKIKHEITVNQSCLNSAQEKLSWIMIIKSGLGPQKNNNKRGIRGIP